MKRELDSQIQAGVAVVSRSGYAYLRNRSVFCKIPSLNRSLLPG